MIFDFLSSAIVSSIFIFIASEEEKKNVYDSRKKIEDGTTHTHTRDEKNKGKKRKSML